MKLLSPFIPATFFRLTQGGNQNTSKTQKPLSSLQIVLSDQNYKIQQVISLPISFAHVGKVFTQPEA